MSTHHTTHMTFSRRFWRAAFVVLMVSVLASWLLPSFQRLLPSISGTAAFGSLIILGFVASVSSCLATTGGFLVAFVAEAPSRTRLAMVHVGRMSAFIVGGSILGAIGGVVPTWSPTWYGLLALIMGVGFLGVALHLFDLAPSWASLGISLPASLHGFGARIRQGNGPLAPFLVGATTFILPCGFTQTAQGLALISGSPLKGAVIMGAFALGTLPMLLGLTTFASKARLSHPYMRLAAGAMLFLFAMNQIGSGAAILGLVSPKDTSIPVAAVRNDLQEQVVGMTVTAYSYVPSNITIKRGVPVIWQVYAGDASGCTSSLVSRELGISAMLKKGMNEFTFTPQRAGTIAFSCGMGMVRGSFTVVN